MASPTSNSPTSTGRAAEALGAEFLEARGYQILDRNWRNRWCELDLVAVRAGTVHFVEVKYRATTVYGRPEEFINRDKIARLTRAALAWNQAHRHTGPYQIDVISVTGSLSGPYIELFENAISA